MELQRYGWRAEEHRPEADIDIDIIIKISFSTLTCMILILFVESLGGIQGSAQVIKLEKKVRKRTIKVNQSQKKE